MHNTSNELRQQLMILLSLQHLQHSVGELWQWACGCSTQAWWFEVWVGSRFKTSNRLLIKVLFFFFQSGVVCIFNSVPSCDADGLHFYSVSWCLDDVLYDTTCLRLLIPQILLMSRQQIIAHAGLSQRQVKEVFEFYCTALSGCPFSIKKWHLYSDRVWCLYMKHCVHVETFY